MKVKSLACLRFNPLWDLRIPVHLWANTEVVTADPSDVAFVQHCLDKMTVSEGRYIEDMIFLVDLYIEDAVFSRDQKAEIIAITIVEIQKVLPIGKGKDPIFPTAITKDYWDEVEAFLEGEGKEWGRSSMSSQLSNR